jgi:hypothetical protein
VTTATYTPRSWADALLEQIGAPVDATNEQTIVDWEAAEGGAGPEWAPSSDNVTNYNPLNVSLTTGAQGYGYDPGTGEFFPGASPTPGNNPPIASFSDWGTGLAATAARLEEPFASSILADLQGSAPESTTASAVGASGWGTGDFANRNSPGTASGSGPAGTVGGATATDASLNANPFDLFGIPQTITGDVASSIWSEVGPFIAKTLLVVAGLGLIGLGLYKVTDTGKAASQLAPLAEAAAA